MLAAMQKELLSKSIIPYFVEWCATPMEARPGVAFQDKCLLFDVNGENVKYAAKSPAERLQLH